MAQLITALKLLKVLSPDLIRGGILRIFKLPRNSGISSTPRNIGIPIARGKYIAFLDSDDLFTKTALEEFSTLAEDYQADVIHTNQFFRLWNGKAKSVDDPAFTDMNKLIHPANFSVCYDHRSRPDKPTFMADDLGERVEKFVTNQYTREPYVTFYRRDFLISERIIFPDVFIHHDEPFAFQGMCLAKKVLHVPNINYIVRPRAGSIMREQFKMDYKFHKTLRICVDGFRAFADILNGINFFSEHPDYRYDVLNWYIQNKSYLLRDIYAKNNPAELYPLIEKEFSSDEAPFAAYLFNTMKVQQLQIEKLQAELRKFQQQ